MKEVSFKVGCSSQFLSFPKKAAELDRSQLAWELYENKSSIKVIFNFFNPDQLAMVFTQLGFEIEIPASSPAPLILCSVGTW